MAGATGRAVRRAERGWRGRAQAALIRGQCPRCGHAFARRPVRLVELGTADLTTWARRPSTFGCGFLYEFARYTEQDVKARRESLPGCWVGIPRAILSMIAACIDTILFECQRTRAELLEEGAAPETIRQCNEFSTKMIRQSWLALAGWFCPLLVVALATWLEPRHAISSLAYWGLLVMRLLSAYFLMMFVAFLCCTLPMPRAVARFFGYSDGRWQPHRVRETGFVGIVYGKQPLYAAAEPRPFIQCIYRRPRIGNLLCRLVDPYGDRD